MTFKLYLITIMSILTTITSELCTYVAEQKYNNLLNTYPTLSNQLKTMATYPLPIWYTDKDSHSLENIKNTLQNCGQSISVVIIYGMPNKDCAAHESSGGTNQNENDYQQFITNLHNIVNDSEIIYIIEPDAISLSTDNKCGIQNNYIGNIKNALSILSKNPNARIYLDIGYWTLLYGDQQIEEILNIINIIDPDKKIKGISLNLSNYRTNTETINSCQRINDLSNNRYKCIIDTSRNANGPNNDNTWCNLKSAGIGTTPTSDTGNSNVDYFLWLKPAIEVDGHCYGSSNSYQTSKNAGEVDPIYFQMLWDNGILKNKPEPTYLRCGNN